LHQGLNSEVKGEQPPAKEAYAFLRFGIVGALATMVHAAVVTGLIVSWGVNPMVANVSAFSVAFSFSFVGHYKWTFASSARQSRALVRFLIVAIAAFTANNLLLVALLHRGLLSDLATVLVSILVIPVITYIVGRFWAFSGGW